MKSSTIREPSINYRSMLLNIWANFFSEFSDLFYKMELKEESDNYEEKCFELLQSYLKRNRKKLVLLFDNFGVFLNKLTDREH